MIILNSSPLRHVLPTELALCRGSASRMRAQSVGRVVVLWHVVCMAERFHAYTESTIYTHTHAAHAVRVEEERDKKSRMKRYMCECTG